MTVTIKQAWFDKLRTTLILWWLNTAQWMLSVTPERVATFSVYVGDRNVGTQDLTLGALLKYKVKEDA